MFCGRQFCSRQKGGDAVGKTKRGKGTKWMVAVDGQGIALGSTLHSASPAEATLVEGTLATISVPRQHGGRPRQKPQRVIAERANDSDSLRRWLQARGIELVCSHRKSRRKPPTQDGRALRRYRKRWKVEGTFVWLGNFRRLVVRYERHSLMYQAFFRIACLLVSLWHL
jgi:transposase